MRTRNVLIVGVGGQGTLLSSRILGKLLLESGLDVKMSEAHGMSQRGGSVVTCIRYGDKVHSPVIDEGEADIILAFEALEALRHLRFARTDGVIVANEQRIKPMPVLSGERAYPEDPFRAIRESPVRLLALDALSIAEKAGTAKAVNLVLLGVASRFFDFKDGQWESAIRELVPEKSVDVNLKAFRLGVENGKIL